MRAELEVQPEDVEIRRLRRRKETVAILLGIGSRFLVLVGDGSEGDRASETGPCGTDNDVGLEGRVVGEGK